MSAERRATWALSPRTFLVAAGVGVIGGLVACAFQAGGRALQGVIIGEGSLLDAASGLSWISCILIPVGGALVAAFLQTLLTRRRASQGTAEVMEAVTLRTAKTLSIRATVSRALASLALIVTGGSIGREGPNAYMAASFGARFARTMGVPFERLGLFAGCGIAAGMAASYFAPLGAAVFALEAVLRNFAAEFFGPVVVAAIVASLVVEFFSQTFLSGLLLKSPLYDLPPFTEGRLGEAVIFVLLGVAAAYGAWFFIRTMGWVERLFQRLPASPFLRLPLGGLILGLIGIFLPEVWGNGYAAVNIVLQTARPMLGFVLVLFVMKIFATSVTLGSGGSGGIFTPTLFVGVVLGLFVGKAAQFIAPGLVSNPLHYAVVGMAGAITAVTQAPITAIFLLFELTRETALLMPLMLTVVAAQLTSRKLGLEGVYVAALKRKGIPVPEGIEETALATTQVEDVMREEKDTVPMRATFEVIVERFRKTRRDYVYVAGLKGEFRGVIRLHDVKNFLTDQELGAAVIAADLLVNVPHCYRDQSLADIMPRFDSPDAHEMPVVDRETERFVGVVDRRDVLSHLAVEVLDNRDLRAKFVEQEGAQHYVEIPAGHVLGRIEVPPDMVGKTFASTGLRSKTGLNVLTVVRPSNGGETRLLPQADMVLQAGDALIVIGPVDAVRELGGDV